MTIDKDKARIQAPDFPRGRAPASCSCGRQHSRPPPCPTGPRPWPCPKCSLVRLRWQGLEHRVEAVVPDPVHKRITLKTKPSSLGDPDCQQDLEIAG